MRLLYVLSLMLCVPLCAGAVPSEFLTTGDGSYYNPYRLSKAVHLAELDKEVRGGTSFAGKFLVLAADIDMSELPEWAGVFAGIGEADENAMFSSSFCGDFNGRHFTVSNLDIDASDDYGCGLFNSVDGGAYIHHLLLDSSCSVSGGCNTGAVAGTVWDGMVEFCSSAAAVRGLRNVGGIAGTLHSGAVRHCSNTARVDAVKGVGGIVGLMDGITSVTGCYNTGVVAASTFGACAGIAGQGFGRADVMACYNTGLVSGRRSEEFDIELSNILSDAPAVVWKGSVAGCCAVSALSGIAEDGVTDFSEAEFRTATPAALLNDALESSDYSPAPNSTAVAADRRFTFAAGVNGGFPVLGWELNAPGSAIAGVAPDGVTGFVVEGTRVYSVSGAVLRVADLSGRIVAQGADLILSPGVYLVGDKKILIN